MNVTRAERTSGDPELHEFELARLVVRNRLAQLMINEKIRAKAFRIPVHLALGHEAIAVAVGSVMRPADALCLTHRNVHYNIARAASLREELSELLLRADGVAGGRTGCMNMTNAERGIVYTSSILGNNLCVAAGIALAERVAGTCGAVFIVTGDGAMEEGAFFESLELLKSAGLAAVVIVENNEWSMFTRIEERRCAIDLSRFASAFDVPFVALSGNEPWTYAAQLGSAREHAVGNGTPVIVEVALHTLGDFVSDGDGRHVNYHHGLAAPVELSTWPLIAHSADDPLFVLAARFGEASMREIARTELALLQQEVVDDVR